MLVSISCLLLLIEKKISQAHFKEKERINEQKKYTNIFTLSRFLEEEEDDVDDDDDFSNNFRLNFDLSELDEASLFIFSSMTFISFGCCCFFLLDARKSLTFLLEKLRKLFLTDDDFDLDFTAESTSFFNRCLSVWLVILVPVVKNEI